METSGQICPQRVDACSRVETFEGKAGALTCTNTLGVSSEIHTETTRCSALLVAFLPHSSGLILHRGKQDSQDEAPGDSSQTSGCQPRRVIVFKLGVAACVCTGMHLDHSACKSCTA